MQAPGFWDDQERAAKVSAEHTRASSAGSIPSGRWSRDAADLDELAEMAAEDDEIADRARVAARLGRGPARRARGGAPVQWRVRRRRRAS